MTDMIQPRSPLQDMRGMANLFVMAVRIGAVVTEPFIRKGFGFRYLGGKAAAAFLLMPFFSVFFPEDDPRPLLWFDGAFFVMCAIARLDGFRLRARGYQVHSNYNGFPLFLKANATAKRELREKAFGEPFMVGLVGGVIYAYYSPPLGALLITSAVCLFLSHGINQSWVDRQAADMRDAMMSQQHAMDRYRELYGDR